MPHFLWIFPLIFKWGKRNANVKSGSCSNDANENRNIHSGRHTRPGEYDFSFSWRIEVAARFNFVTFVCGILFISIIIIIIVIFPFGFSELRKITAENVLLNCWLWNDWIVVPLHLCFELRLWGFQLFVYSYSICYAFVVNRLWFHVSFAVLLHV